ncbi:tellurite resistance TerB family protein, partial [Bordetella pertussis]
MSARQLLDQLLQSGQSLMQGAGAQAQQATQGGKGTFLAGLGGGALGAGALGLLLGSKKARKIGGKVAMYGGMAALGALAYRAYDQYQRNQAG